VRVFGAVVRFVVRSIQRLAITVAGLALLLAGAIMLVTPGPGLLAIIAGLAVLATEYAWARRALERTRERSRQAVQKVREVRWTRRGAADQPGAEPDS
jgi:uncharacterized protein (TIGR02611 family)